MHATPPSLPGVPVAPPSPGVAVPPSEPGVPASGHAPQLPLSQQVPGEQLASMAATRFLRDFNDFLRLSQLVGVVPVASAASYCEYWGRKGACLPSSSVPPARGHRLFGLTVLVVEDDSDSREFLTQLLKARSATCIAAATGYKAFDEFTCRRPDIIVSDLWMPDGDGFELIRRIRALPPEQGGLTPAVAVSAGVNTERALMAGYHAMLSKPLEPDRVVEVVEQFFGIDTESASWPSPWTVSAPSRGALLLTLWGYVGTSHMRAAVEVLLDQLEWPTDIIVDCRRLTGFSPAVASIAHQMAWTNRHQVRRVRILGGPASARWVAMAVCVMLGIDCAVEE
jgi:CheY-like chemotaxis protein